MNSESALTISTSRLPLVAKQLAIALGFFLLGIVGVRYFALVGQTISPVWPASGFALAVVLLGGRKYLFGVFIGALFVSATIGTSWYAALALSSATLAEISLAEYLLRKFGFNVDLCTINDALKFSAAAYIAPAVSAMIGATVFLYFGLIPTSRFWMALATWWAGDGTGILLFTFPVIGIAQWRSHTLRKHEMFEFVGVLIAAILLTDFAFHLSSSTSLPFHNIVLPVLAYGAVRLNLSKASLILCSVGTMATLHTALGVGAFASQSAFKVFVQLDGYLSMLAISLLVIGSSIRRSERLQHELHETIDRERNGSDQLRKSEERFQLASRASGDVIWDWNIETDQVTWSERFFELFGFSRTEELNTVQGWAKLVHPEDAWVISPTIERFRQFEYRLKKADGTYAWVKDRAVSVFDESGRRIRSIGTITDITESKAAHSALESSEERYRRLFERNLAGVFRSTPEGKILECNQAQANMFGYSSPEECYVDSAIDLYSDPRNRASFIAEVSETGYVANKQLTARRKDGTTFPALCNMSVAEFEGVTVLEGVMMDLTNVQRLESQLRQAQKMEAIGRLAGGVAHDFNNLLMVISSYSELLAMSISGDRERRAIEQILDATLRGSELTKQLLAFSRQQVISPRPVNLSEELTRASDMIRRLVGEEIQLIYHLTPEISCCRLDPNQIQQIALNLIVNSKDAMPRGGTITISTANVSMDEKNAAAELGGLRGPFVRWTVTDTGTGMTPQTQARIFEPFFTTKELGKGTGLGLATVYGIVKQSSGHIRVRSEIGIGSSFDIFFPAIERPAREPSSCREECGDTFSGTVLLVEDDPALRIAAAEYLGSIGFEVLTASGFEEAMLEAAEFKGTIDVLVTDIVMPGASGIELATALKKSRDLRVIYMSGYAREHGTELSTPFAQYLQKPFSLATLANAVHFRSET